MTDPLEKMALRIAAELSVAQKAVFGDSVISEGQVKAIRSLLAEAWNAALADAVLICENVELAHDGGAYDRGVRDGAEDCSEGIRALKREVNK